MKVDNPKPIRPGGAPAQLDPTRARPEEAGGGVRAGGVRDTPTSAEQRTAGPGAPADSVQVAAAAELHELVELVRALPEGEDEVAAIQRAVRDGSYRPDWRALAERLIEDPEFLNALVSRHER